MNSLKSLKKPHELGLDLRGGYYVELREDVFSISGNPFQYLTLQQGDELLPLLQKLGAIPLLCEVEGEYMYFPNPTSVKITEWGELVVEGEMHYRDTHYGEAFEVMSNINSIAVDHIYIKLRQMALLNRRLKR